MEYCPYGSLEEYLMKGNRKNEKELREVLSCCFLDLSSLLKRSMILKVSD